MESNVTSTTFRPALPVVDHGAATTGAWTYRLDLETTRSCVAVAPRRNETRGTGVPVAGRGRTAVAPAPMAAVKALALLPINDVVDVKGFDNVAGIRSWSPPV